MIPKVYLASLSVGRQDSDKKKQVENWIENTWPETDHYRVSHLLLGQKNIFW